MRFTSQLILGTVLYGFSLCLLAACHTHHTQPAAAASKSTTSGVKSVAKRTANAIGQTTQRVQQTITSTAKDTHNLVKRFTKEVRQAPALGKREIVFPFDSASISPDDLKILQIHADFLKSHPHLKVILVGHADQRGNDAYNLSLAKKRAEAVASQLRHYGVASERITVRSAGTTRPRTTGSNEKDWLRNRRVEILYG